VPPVEGGCEGWTDKQLYPFGFDDQKQVNEQGYLISLSTSNRTPLRTTTHNR